MLSPSFLKFILVGVLTTSVYADTRDCSPVGPRESYSTADFSRVVAKCKVLVNKYPKAGVLVVVDIDNTLLAMNQDLGSDQWFNWQRKLLKDEPSSTDLVADDVAGLLRVQGILFALSEMHPPEPELPGYMSELQKLSLTTVVLTSRRYAFRDAAERELERNGYHFGATALSVKERRGLFMPFDPAHPRAHGLSQEITEKIRDGLRPVSYSNGIYMTAGQHKGYMLRTLLARAEPKQSFNAILFVDDHKKNTLRMHEAFEGDPIHLVTFQYTREAGNVSNFNASQKRHVVDGWRRLKCSAESVLVK